MKIYYIIPSSSSIQAMALWPCVLANRSLRGQGVSERLLIHERIHHKQQIELLILPFYVWYILEWLFKWIVYKDRKRAYRAISFEKEAYVNDKDIDYLPRRRFWNFLKYL